MDSWQSGKEREMEDYILITNSDALIIIYS